MLLGRRERVHDPVHGLGRVLGVKRREDEVAGLGGGQGRRHRLEVAHLAYEDHVRVLAEGGLEPLGEGGRVGSELALVDDALLVAVQELDRVLDREDVLVALLVDPVDHRGERRRLTGPGRPGNEHEAARLVREVEQHRRQAELLELGDIRRNRPHDRANRRPLEERVHAEAGLVRDCVREVDLPVGLEPLALLVVEDRVDDLARVLRRERRVVERAQPPAFAHHGRRTGGEVEVGRSGLDYLEQDVGEVEVHRLGPFIGICG